MGELVSHLPVPESDGAGQSPDRPRIAPQERPTRRRVGNSLHRIVYLAGARAGRLDAVLRIDAYRNNPEVARKSYNFV